MKFNEKIMEELEKFSKEDKDRMILILISMQLELELEYFDSNLIGIISQFNFIENDFYNIKLKLKEPFIFCEKEINEKLTEFDIKGLEEIREMFKERNRKRAGNMPAIKNRFLKLKKEYEINISDAVIAAKRYLEDEDNPNMIITCQKFFYRGPWSDRDSLLIGYLEDNVININDEIL